jgi:hypothetical protein
MAKSSKKGGKEEDVNTMFELKHLIEKSSNTILPENESDVKRIHSELDELNKRFEELKDVVVGVKKEGESSRKKKVKREIVRLLQEKKRLNPTQMGKLLGLSRVRSNEYLREMEDDKILKGIIVKKRKFYMLEKGLTSSQ